MKTVTGLFAAVGCLAAFGYDSNTIALYDFKSAETNAVGEGTEKFPLVEKGAPVATIVRAPAAKDAIAFFQSEAAKCLAGKRFPEADAPAADGRSIVFDVRAAALREEDAYEIAFPDARTMKISCTGVSAQYAVARVLREAFGVRWPFIAPKDLFGEELNEYPPATDVALAMKPYRQGPMSYWIMREAGWRDMSFKRNCWENKGHRLVHGIMWDVIPIAKYAEKGNFPKVYWSVQTGSGERVPPHRAKGPLSKNVYEAMEGYGGGWNPCFSDPAAVPVAVADVLEKLAENPGQKSVNIEVCDNGFMCRCERCRKIVGGRLNSMRQLDYSGVYWPFVAAVARGVKAKRPDVIFSALSYREVTDPPAERLPDNVLVRLCFEHSAMIDPEVAAIRRRVLADWAKKCSLLEFYDYNYGQDVYLLPRVYFTLRGALLKEFSEKYGACSCYSEMRERLPFEGPKSYVLSKLLTDVSADPWKLVREWCVDAVGEAAAEPLCAYWKFWEDYSCGTRVRETPWFLNSRFNIYQQFGQASQAYGLRRGDMARQRARMEEVVAKAATPSQRKRAAVMMDMHALTEDGVAAVFAEYLEPDGTLKSAADAVELLKALPAAVAAERRRRESKYAKFKFMGVGQGLRSGLGAILPYVGDAGVKSLLEKYAGDKTLPADIRGLLRVWSGRPGVNLLPNASFEEKEPLPACWRGGKAIGRRTDRLASDGKFSFGGCNPMLEYRLRVEPDKTYVFLIDAYADAGSSEGRFSYQFSPYHKDRNAPQTHINYADLTLPAGRWQTLTGIVQTSKTVGDLYINVWCKKYERNENVYVDNVRLYCVE